MGGIVWPTTDYKPSRHGPLLLEGARMLNDPTSAVRWRGSAGAARILLVMVYMPPEEPYERDGRMGFYVTRPEGSRQGPLVDASLLRYLRAKGWRLHRIMVTGYCLWDRYGTVNGRLVPLTVPAKVRTDAAGYAVSATGRVLNGSQRLPVAQHHASESRTDRQRARITSQCRPVLPLAGRRRPVFIGTSHRGRPRARNEQSSAKSRWLP